MRQLRSGIKLGEAISLPKAECLQEAPLMLKILTLGCDGKRLSEVNGLLRAKGHAVRGADCRSGMRHLLSVEAFQCIVLVDALPLGFSEALRHELRAGRMSPRVVNALGMEPDDVAELVMAETSRRQAAA